MGGHMQDKVGVSSIMYTYHISMISIETVCTQSYGYIQYTKRDVRSIMQVFPLLGSLILLGALYEAQPRHI